MYEVAWLRLLTMTMGHTTGAAGAVLAAFMGGLALGAWLAGRLTPGLTPRRALRAYAALETAIAVCALAMPYALSAIRPLLAWAYADGNGGALFGATRLAVSIVLIALPAAAMGGSFPVGVVVIDDGNGARGARGAMGARSEEQGAERSISSAARDTAGLYAANTMGAAIGAAMQMKADAPELAFLDYAEALKLAPDDPEALAGFVRAAAANGQLGPAETYLRTRRAAAESSAVNLELARALAFRGKLDDAAVAAQRGAALDPSNERARDQLQLVTVLADDHSDAALEELTALLVRAGTTRPVTLSTRRCVWRTCAEGSRLPWRSASD